MWGIGVACTGYRNVGESHKYGETDVDGRIVLRCVFRE